MNLKYSHLTFKQTPTVKQSCVFDQHGAVFCTLWSRAQTFLNSSLSKLNASFIFYFRQVLLNYRLVSGAETKMLLFVW